MFNRTTPTKLIAQRRQKNKIRNPNIERSLADRNKPEDLNPNDEIRNRLVWNVVIFDHLELFRISPACLAAGRDFEFRIRIFI